MLNKNKQGFTLIELLVVIAIIGMLAASVMVSMSTARAKARDARRISDIKNLDLAIALYFDGAGEMPKQLADLATTYITKIPKDPDTGLDYNYFPFGTVAGATVKCTKYHLGATLEQGSPAVLNDIDMAESAQSIPCTGGIGNAFEGFSKTCGGAATAVEAEDRCYDTSN